jgi:hypothetical protein
MMAEVLSAVKGRSEAKEPPSRSAFAELASMRGARRATEREEAADDQDFLRHAVAGSKGGRSAAPPPRARFADVLTGLGGPARAPAAPRGRSREPQDEDDGSGSESGSTSDAIDPDDVAASLREDPEQLVRTVLSMLRRGGFRSATEWAEKTKFDESRNKRECMFLADVVDDYLSFHRDSYDYILAKLMARMVGVQMADHYKDWSYCNVITGAAAPGLLLDLAWMKRIRRSARVYRSFAPAPPKSDSKKSNKSGSGSRNKSGYDYSKSADGDDKQRSSSKGKSKGKNRKSGKSPSGPSKDSAASGKGDGGDDK